MLRIRWPPVSDNAARVDLGVGSVRGFPRMVGFSLPRGGQSLAGARLTRHTSGLI